MYHLLPNWGSKESKDKVRMNERATSPQPLVRRAQSHLEKSTLIPVKGKAPFAAGKHRYGIIPLG